MCYTPIFSHFEIAIIPTDSDAEEFTLWIASYDDNVLISPLISPFPNGIRAIKTV